MVCPGDVYWQAIKAFELHDPCKAIHDDVKSAMDVSSDVSIHTASLCVLLWNQLVPRQPLIDAVLEAPYEASSQSRNVVLPNLQRQSIQH